MLKINRPTSADFLAGGGDMGALTRAYDWSANPLGTPEHWPQSLRTALRILLNTNHPMFIWWGPKLIQFYNDAYRQTMGSGRTRAGRTRMLGRNLARYRSPDRAGDERRRGDVA